MKFFECRKEEIEYLRSCDSVLASVIDCVGDIHERIDPNVYTALVRNIIGQQISIPVYERTWASFQARFGEVPDPELVLSAGTEGLRGLGIAVRRAEYILGISRMALDGGLDDSEFARLSDEEVMERLTSLRGIGPWTAEMVMLFCLERRDVFSFLDIALIRGLKRMYRLDDVPKAVFESYRKLFSPCGSVASLYIWEVGEGRVPVIDCSEHVRVKS